MAFPQVVATNGGTNNSSASQVLNLPADIAAGDLLVAVLAVSAAARAYWPAGWIELFDISYATSMGLSAGYRIAAGGETTVTVGLSLANYGAYQSFRITDYVGTPEVGVAATGANTTPDPPSLTPTWGELDTLWLAFAGNDSSEYITVYPANYTDGRNDHASYVGVASAKREIKTLGEDPGAFTLNNTEEWVANTIAIQPIPSPIIPPTRKLLITHAAIKDVKVYQNGSLVTSYENLSNLDEERIESGLEIPITTPATVEVVTITDRLWTFDIPP